MVPQAVGVRAFQGKRGSMTAGGKWTIVTGRRSLVLIRPRYRRAEGFDMTCQASHDPITFILCTCSTKAPSMSARAA
jgi:hypothetical protein